MVADWLSRRGGEETAVVDCEVWHTHSLTPHTLIPSLFHSLRHTHSHLHSHTYSHPHTLIHCTLTHVPSHPPQSPNLHSQILTALTSGTHLIVTGVSGECVSSDSVMMSVLWCQQHLRESRDTLKMKVHVYTRM